MERIAPAGDVYQAGTLSGNPLAVAAGLATLELLDSAAYAQLRETTTALADGIETIAAGRGRRGAGAARDRPLHVFFSERAGRPTTTAPRPPTPSATPPSAARCSSAASTRPPRSSRPGSRRWPTSADHVERTLAAVARGVRGDRRRVSGAAPRQSPPRSTRRCARTRSTSRRTRATTARSTPTAPSCSRRSARATRCTTARRAPSRAWTRTCGCWPATRSTRWACRAWPSWATCPPWPSWPT